MKTKENVLENRIIWIDIAKGIGILAMMLGHSFYGNLKPIIYSFHMPLFFILAGYTIKEFKGNIFSVEFKDFKRLIVPCLVVRAIILLGNCMINHQNLTVELKTFFLSVLWGNHYGSFFGIGLPSIGRIWFLPTLFISKFIYRIMIGKFDEKCRFPLLVILSLICMFLGSHNVILPQNIDMIFVCVLFMDVGHKLKEMDLSKLKWYMVYYFVSFRLLDMLQLLF